MICTLLTGQTSKEGILMQKVISIKIIYTYCTRKKYFKKYKKRIDNKTSR